MTLTQRDGSAYAAARAGTAVCRVPDPGWLRIAGADRREFIQRQTTNDIRTLAGDQPQQTVLTSPTARILDVWWLVDEGESIGVLTLPGRGAATAQYLQSRIFFMDKVTVTDASAEIAQFEILGAALPDLGGIVIQTAGGGRVVVPVGAADSMVARLAGAVTLTPDVYDLLRIEAGLPAVGHELTDAYTPLEANLDAAISGAKGCYTGQEIIARQVTYDKVTRRLVGLRLDAPVEAGAAVRVADRGAGEVTSAVVSPDFGPIALAVIKRPHHTPGTVVTVGDVRGDVVGLPFRT